MGKSGVMAPPRNVLFITLDQWRGDCLSALGHPVVETPTLDALAARGVLFANHWANAAPCGPSRACLYTGTYQHRNRSILNGTPLDARFTNVALLAREAGYDPVLFGYTDTSVDPRTVPPGDPRLFSYEGVLPGFRALIEDPWEQGSPAWGRWLAAQGVDVPANPHDLYEPMEGFPGADAHGSTWAPARFPAELSQTTFVRRAVSTGWSSTATSLSSSTRPSSGRIRHGATRSGTTTSTPPTRSGRSPAVPRRRTRRPSILSARSPWARPGSGASRDERERRQVRATYYGAQREVDDGLAPLFAYLDAQRAGRVDAGRPHERPRRDGGRPLAAREARLLGRELPRPADRGGPPAGGGRAAADDRRGRHRVGGRAADDLRVPGGRGATAGGRLVPRPLPPRRAGARALARHGPLRMGLLGPGRSAGRTGLRDPDEPLLAGRLARARGTSTSSSPRRPTLFPPLLFDLARIPGRRTTSWPRTCRAAATRRGGRPGTGAVAHAHGRAHAERHLPRSRAGPGRGAGHWR